MYTPPSTHATVVPAVGVADEEAVDVLDVEEDGEKEPFFYFSVYS